MHDRKNYHKNTNKKIGKIQKRSQKPCGKCHVIEMERVCVEDVMARTELEGEIYSGKPRSWEKTERSVWLAL